MFSGCFRSSAAEEVTPCARQCWIHCRASSTFAGTTAAADAPLAAAAGAGAGAGAAVAAAWCAAVAGFFARHLGSEREIDRTAVECF